MVLAPLRLRFGMGFGVSGLQTKHGPVKSPAEGPGDVGPTAAIQQTVPRKGPTPTAARFLPPDTTYSAVPLSHHEIDSSILSSSVPVGVVGDGFGFPAATRGQAALLDPSCH